MNSDLKQLIRLQSIDTSIQELRGRIDKFPSISKALDEKLRSAQASLDAAKERTKNNQTHRKKLETDITAIEAKVSKYREQMLSVKTNDEYRALQHVGRPRLRNSRAGLLSWVFSCLSPAGKFTRDVLMVKVEPCSGHSGKKDYGSLWRSSLCRSLFTRHLTQDAFRAQFLRGLGRVTPGFVPWWSGNSSWCSITPEPSEQE